MIIMMIFNIKTSYFYKKMFHYFEDYVMDLKVRWCPKFENKPFH